MKTDYWYFGLLLMDMMHNVVSCYGHDSSSIRYILNYIICTMKTLVMC